MELPLAIFHQCIQSLELHQLQLVRTVSKYFKSQVDAALQLQLCYWGFREAYTVQQAQLVYSALTARAPSYELLRITTLPPAQFDETFAYWWKQLDLCQVRKFNESESEKLLTYKFIFSLITGRTELSSRSEEFIVQLEQAFAEYDDEFADDIQLLLVNHHVQLPGCDEIETILTVSTEVLDKLVATKRAVPEMYFIPSQPHLVFNWQLTDLIHLHCAHGKLEHFELQGVAVSNLDLSYNQLTEFPSHLLSKLRQTVDQNTLKQLNLSGNPLVKFEIHFASHLSILSMSNCNLTTVPEIVLERLPGLRNLDLSYNQLTEAPLYERKLNILNLRGNRLTNLSEAFIKLVPFYKILELSENQLSVIHFEYREQRQIIYLTDNPLQQVKLLGSKGTTFDAWKDPVASSNKHHYYKMKNMVIHFTDKLISEVEENSEVDLPLFIRLGSQLARNK